jgi:hypothetical protein
VQSNKLCTGSADRSGLSDGCNATFQVESRSMSIRPSLGWIFPTTLFGFVAVSVMYFNVVFTPAARWALLACLSVFLLHRGRLFLALRIPPAPLLLAWVSWCALTVVWSDAPLLTGMKSVAAVVVVFAMTSGGIYWAQYVRPDVPISYLAPVMAISVFAALAGFQVIDQTSGGLHVLRGLTTNANLLGTMLAEGLPFPMFAAYRAYMRHPAQPVRWIGWAAASLGTMILLLLTGARSAALCAACIVIAFAAATFTIRAWLGAGLLACVVAAALIVLPAGLGSGWHPVTQFITKGHAGLLYSRERVWRTSYENAAKGGSLGLGLGVSADAGRFTGSVTATDYGREKGTSQLAILEETGVVGLAIYLALLGGLFRCLLRETTLVEGAMRVQLLLLLGVAAGLVLQSVFEGWWTSPGSLQSILFWSAIGVAFGLRHRSTGSPAEFCRYRPNERLP